MKLVGQNYLPHMRVYFTRMFPLHLRFVEAGLLYISFTLALARIHNVPASLWSPVTLIGIWSVFAITLILRLMDELKDVEIDRQLFRDRPLPSGEVSQQDISFTLLIVITLFLLPNLWLGEVMGPAVIVLAYALLMYKYFFIPGVMRRYLLVALASHNPIVPIMLLYLISVFLRAQQLSWLQLDLEATALLVVMYWALFFSWEISRKIRCKADENAYVTYSQIFGRIGAVIVAASAQLAVCGIAIYFQMAFSWTWLFVAIVLLGMAAVVFAELRFILNPSSRTARLKPFAEAFILSIFMAQIIEHSLEGW